MYFLRLCLKGKLWIVGSVARFGWVIWHEHFFKERGLEVYPTIPNNMKKRDQ